MPIVLASELQDLCVTLFVASGASKKHAETVSNSLVDSNLCGLDSHGIMRVPQYLTAIAAEEIRTNVEPLVTKQQGCVTKIDGQWCFGQVAAQLAVETCISGGEHNGVAITTIFRVAHIGRLGEWANQVANAGFICLIMTNGSRPGGLVAPYGSKQRGLGTNPIAIAIPRTSKPAIVLDMATSAVAEGKVRHANFSGKKIPDGWVMDKHGHPTNDPQDLYDGGALYPLGGHKGYGLSIMVEILAGILSGAMTPIFPGYNQLENGVFMMALKPSLFQNEDVFNDSIDTFEERIKTLEPDSEIPNAEIMFPGEPEFRAKSKRETSGVKIDEGTWDAIRKEAQELDVNHSLLSEEAR